MLDDETITNEQYKAQLAAAELKLGKLETLSNCIWIPAHRVSMLEADQVSMDRHKLQQFEQQSQHHASQPHARYRQLARHSGQGGAFDASIFALEGLSNFHARTVRDKVNGENELSTKDKADPLDDINGLLASCNLTVRFCMNKNENGELVAFHEQADNHFSIAKCSDGERSLIYLLSNVIRAKSGALIIIDEPERHLHTGIARDFLSSLLELRKDCYFVVSTHELSLASSIQTSGTLIVDKCVWKNNSPEYFSFRKLENDSALPEDLKIAILGGREKVLFVEGKDIGSLDLELYQRLFPNVNIKAKGGCQEIIQAVKGLNSTNETHHTDAYGLIDRDSKPNAQVIKLQAEKIFALQVCSVESLYYCEDSIREIVGSHCKSIDEPDTEKIYDKALSAALNCLRNKSVQSSLAYHRTLGNIKHTLETSMPSRDDIMSGEQISISPDNEYSSNLATLKGFIEDSKWDEIISKYKIKSTNAAETIADKIGLGKTEGNKKTQYEMMVRKRISVSDEFAEKLKAKLENLSEALSE